MEIFLISLLILMKVIYILIQELIITDTELDIGI